MLKSWRRRTSQLSMVFLLWVVVIVSCLFLLARLLRDDEFDKLPGPKGYHIFGNSLDFFMMETVPLFYHFRNLCTKYSDLFKLNMGPMKVLILYNPEDVETLISGSKYNEKGFVYSFIRPWLKEGLLLSDGSKWQQRRKILTPAFHFNILRNFNYILQENSWKFVDRLRHEENERKTEVSSMITGFTLDSICETSMGTQLDSETSEFGKTYKDAIHRLGQCVVYRGQRVWTYSEFIFNRTSVGRKFNDLLSLLTSFRRKVVDKRRNDKQFKNFVFDKDDNIQNEDGLESGKKRLAMLDLLLHAEENGMIDADGIGEEVDTFMFEGHDTTSSALQFAFMLLANNKKCQEEIFEECQKIFGSSDRAADMNDLAAMRYLGCCIKETMRLYPPVPFILRKIGQPLQLKDYLIPVGTECAVMIYDLHRRSDQFKEPLQFRPERFLEEPTWHPYSYIPFSAGPRNCIGQKFAMMEMKLVLSSVLRKYRMLPVTRPQDLVFVTDFILRTETPIYVKFQKR